MQDLQDILSNHVPDYCYFGAHEGDGACFGCWIDFYAIDEAERDGEMAVVTSYNELEAMRLTTVTHAKMVNDHGNVTLYRRSGSRWVECWSVV